MTNYALINTDNLVTNVIIVDGEVPDFITVDGTRAIPTSDQDIRLGVTTWDGTNFINPTEPTQNPPSAA